MRTHGTRDTRYADGGRCSRRGGCRQHRLRAFVPGAALVAVLMAGLMGCTHDVPLVPGATVAYVPRPGEAPTTLPADEVKARYTVFPNRNPDGLGVFEGVWPNSTMTLMVWPIEAGREARNRVAYARTDEEQAAVVARRRAFFREHVVFRGRFISPHRELVDPTLYEPEGIYLLDDRGRRFRPLAVNDGVERYDLDFRLERRLGGGVSPQARETVFGYLYLVFPGEAIGPETRAVTLYFAALQKRIAFTWVFDENYVPEQQLELPGEGGDINRLFPDRSPPRY